MKEEKKLMLALNQLVKGKHVGFSHIASRLVQCGSEHAFRLPMGYCADDVLKRLDTLVAAVGCPVELIDRGGAIQLLVVKKDFNGKIPFSPSDVKDKGIMMGYNRKFEPVYHPLNTHLLVGGASGGGKTVWIQSVAYQLLKQGYIVFIADMKGISFFPFETVPGVVVVDNLESARDMLTFIKAEIDRRKAIIKQTRNKDVIKTFQPIAFIGDEGAVFSPSSHSGENKKLAYECESLIAYMGQQAREFKVFSILAYQRPDEKTINKQYKSNIEATICFRTIDEYNSKIIMNKSGAERISATTPGRCLYTYDREQLLQVPFATEKGWEALLQPFKLEVLTSGKSRRAESQAIHLEGSFESADRHDQTTLNVERLLGPEKESIKGIAGIGAGMLGNWKVPWAGKGMGTHQKRKAVASVPTAEIE